jgi:dihydropyrimidinase
MNTMLLIKNGTLVTEQHTYTADILVEGEKIVQIGASIHIPDAEPVDATGKRILPGGVDPHTHFDLPMFGTVSSGDHYIGHKAAIYGGTIRRSILFPLIFPLCMSPLLHGVKSPRKPQ